MVKCIKCGKEMTYTRTEVNARTGITEDVFVCSADGIEARAGRKK